MKLLLPNNSFRPGCGTGRRSQRGVALIITLILLSVITFMAVTFLVVSRAERSSVGTSTDQIIAREAATAGMERAKAELIASILGYTNYANYDLLVSTNYINPLGYRSGVASYTNVGFTYPNGRPLSGNDALENLTHLLYNPRVPVYVTNRYYANSNEFRFYLDLNRNARYDTNGFQPVINPRGGFYDTNHNWITQIIPGATLSNSFIGDPEWIGRLERIDLPHSATNRFVYRYSYLVVPAGKTLDLNSIHNYAAGSDANMSPAAGGGFARNMGVGTWEINLAAFLTDLNTNFWPFPQGTPYGAPYFYDFNNATRVADNRGAAFDDALSLLRFRYNSQRRSLASVFNTFGLDGANSFRFDRLDGYTRGPVLTTNTVWQALTDLDDPNQPWPGADNPNSYFSTQDLYDKSKTALQLPQGLLSFSDRLYMAGTNVDSYNRYTFYRLLSQLGTDTSADRAQARINLNYDNLVQVKQYPDPANPTGPTISTVAATNFLPWRPIDFFTNTANRLLANAGYDPAGLNIDEIQIYPTNSYTPSVHQMMQLAANIYDATTNRLLATPSLPAPPSVFRPLFGKRAGPGGTNIIFIKGYAEVLDARQVVNNPAVRYRDLSRVDDRNNLQETDMVYGIPLVIGAKKGFPNFNELSMQAMVQISRKLEFRRGPARNVNETNVMYTLSVSNIFGTEAWNSYSNAYPRDLQMRVSVEMFAVITNEFNETLLAVTNPPVVRSNLLTIPAGTWQGFVNPQPQIAQVSFRVPLSPATNSFYFLSNSVYVDATRRFVRLANVGFERHPNSSAFPVPHWWLNLRTRLHYSLIDTTMNPPRIVDFVNLDSEEPPLDIAYILAMDGNCVGGLDNEGRDGSMWCTNRWGGNTLRNPTFGMLNQMSVSLGNVEAISWTSDPKMTDKRAGIDGFRYQFDLSPKYYPSEMFTKSNVFYTPFVPTRTIYFTTEWQANDPLVHYTIGDLTDLLKNFQTNRIQFVSAVATNNIGSINRRYEPWGGNPTAASMSPTARSMAVKDPMVTRSDDWDFPTNKFPSIGWLGRVHRGTPWQTIDLKAATTNLTAWMKWSGNGVLVNNLGQFNTNVVPYNFVTNDAAFTHPINDRYLLDLFTTALNDNASRGQLSVNQTNLAAWSAVLSGVSVLENNRTNRFVTPAGVYSPLAMSPVARIVGGIQRTLTNYFNPYMGRYTNFPGGVFHRLGDILAVPELTVNSPYLNSAYAAPTLSQYRDLNDSVYERIPQQVLGLLKGPDEPRFVIYSWGQALKPAERSLVTSGAYFGLCTNYQVTAEVATRTVVRLEGAPEYPHPLSAQPPLGTFRPVVESFNILPPE